MDKVILLTGGHGVDYSTNTLLANDPSPVGRALSSTTWHVDSWMWDIKDAIHDRPLSYVRMIGSHDAATYAVTSESKYSPDAPGALKNNKVPWLVAGKTRKITAAWAKTQRLNIREQLSYGVRYFDIRLAPRPTGASPPDASPPQSPQSVTLEPATPASDTYSPSPSAVDEELWIVHSMYSVPLRDVIRDVYSFLNGVGTPDEAEAKSRRQREVIIIDVQHVFEWNSEKHGALLLELLRPLAAQIVRLPYGPTSTMGELWSCGSHANNIVLLVPEPVMRHADLAQLCHRRDMSIESPWPNINDKAELVKKWQDMAAERVTQHAAYLEMNARASCRHVEICPLGRPVAEAARNGTSDQPVAASTHRQPYVPSNEPAPVTPLWRPRWDLTLHPANTSYKKLPLNPPVPYVMQGVLTPRTSNVAKGILVPMSVDDVYGLAKTANPIAMKYFKEANLNHNQQISLHARAAAGSKNVSSTPDVDGWQDVSDPTSRLCTCANNAQKNILMIDHVEEGCIDFDDVIVGGEKYKLRTGGVQLCVLLNLMLVDEYAVWCSV